VKSAVVLLSLGLLLALGAVGVLLVSSSHDSAARATETRSASADAGAPSAAGEKGSAEVAQRIDTLSREVDVLREELASMKSSAAREVAPEVAAAAPQPVDDNAAMFAAEHRSAIMKVIEEDRAEQKRKAEEEQRARDLQASLARAERTAKQFGLAADQQKALADIYIAERQKMDDLRNQFAAQGGPGGGGDPEAMRTSFRELRDWRTNELTLRLGADLADKINESDGGGFRGGFGGPGGGGGRRGNGGNGGNGGGN
jgi:hypothetical protein